MKTPFLTGKLVFLRGIERSDLDGKMLHWTDDREVTRYLYRGAYPSSLERMVKDYEVMLESDTEIELVVVDQKTGLPLGVTGLHAINWIARSGESRILIGEKEYWGKGYGTEATQLMVAYGFEVLNLHKVKLGAVEENFAAVKAYEKAGFRKEGVLRDEVYRNGRYYNAVVMSILRNEYWEARKKWKISREISEQFPE